MHPDVIAALKALGKALADNPEDISELQLYGHLADHLSDVLDDLEFME